MKWNISIEFLAVQICFCLPFLKYGLLLAIGSPLFRALFPAVTKCGQEKMWRKLIKIPKYMELCSSQGAFHLMAWPVRPGFLSLYQWTDLVYVSQISSENGPHSINFIKIFRSDKSKAQTFCVSFNNLTVLAGLMESATKDKNVVCKFALCP